VLLVSEHAVPFVVGIPPWWERRDMKYFLFDDHFLFLNELSIDFIRSKPSQSTLERDWPRKLSFMRDRILRPF